MLDKIIFGQLMSELSDFYHRPLSDFIKKVYYQSASDLTTKDFQLAVNKAIFELEFFPTPKKLIAFAKGSMEIMAIEEYLKLLKIASGQIEEKQMATLSPQCLKTMDSLGGLKRFQDESFDSVYGSLQTEFVRRWLNYGIAIEAKTVEASPAMLNPSPEQEPSPTQDMDTQTFGQMMTNIKDILKNKKNNQSLPEQS